MSHTMLSIVFTIDMLLSIYHPFVPWLAIQQSDQSTIRIGHRLAFDRIYGPSFQEQPVYGRINYISHYVHQRSARLAIKKADTIAGVVCPTRLEKAVQNLKDSAHRLKLERLDHTPENVTADAQPEGDAVQQLRNVFNDLTIGATDESEAVQINCILAAVSDIPQTTFNNFDLDKPNSWKEAQNLPYSSQWEAGYCEELNSLKEMSVYKLVHRSQVPPSTKIRKG
ncbi:hypothetical protein BYT27DRAFT_7262979 [Phlegmacium glaucopus]|nr:hypothetical protein BYT27DRAFT_7262979 [Phlegmacium glaucopus]